MHWEVLVVCYVLRVSIEAAQYALCAASVSDVAYGQSRLPIAALK